MRRAAAWLATAATALAAAAGLSVVLAACGSATSGTDRGAVATAQTGTAQDTNTGGPAPAASTATEPTTPPVRRIVVRDGKPVGGVARLEFERGERVRFTVRSDVSDEVHVHGFDISKDVPANGVVAFDFPADIEGVFEIELEGARLKIARLRISP